MQVKGRIFLQCNIRLSDAGQCWQAGQAIKYAAGNAAPGALLYMGKAEKAGT